MAFSTFYVIFITELLELNIFWKEVAMKYKIMTVAVCVFIVMIIAPLGAQQKVEKREGSIGLLFRIESLDMPINTYSDGVMSGAGIKYWVLNELALRALLYFNMFSDSETEETTTNFGFAIAAEYHFIKGTVSPYAGGLAGIEMLINEEQTGRDFYFGGLLGIEIAIADFVSVFAEYGLYVTFREVGTEVDLGSTHAPAIGVIFYFN